MALTASQEATLVEIEAKLATGITSASKGDRRTDYDLSALRSERDRLISLRDSGTVGSRFRRVVFARG